ncbi:hypothetical protein PCYB_041090 [Plasmodium cynomolgi strain B]|uniref:Plasmodium RESA N-terminal domain-containing protein n=1 Tax=Plasmodium cynomolgi (strain B) TaxID=1120755 RepID=K6V709_PLACD|nr:hypothetical protein PCYB_041090 [Plasmodium cynomolgi strain B]GAB64907.1 hypothetical protein PCYB_041090 [Plasmodium cynomolgi strain B]
MGNTRRKFFANGLATPLKVSIHALLFILLLNTAEILDPHPNENSYMGLSCSNGGRSLANAIPPLLGEVAREMTNLTPPKNMGIPISTSTNSHMPTLPKTKNQRHKYVCTSDKALFELRLKMNSYINKHKMDLTKHNQGNIQTKKKIKNNLKVYERELKHQIDSLNFYVDKKEMYKIWGNIYDKRRHIYIDMIKTLWDKCVHLTEKKQIPKKVLFKVWWKAYSDFMVELQNCDSQSMSSFYDLYYKDRCPRYNYMEFIMQNKKSWKKFTTRMKNKWTNDLLAELRAYSK